MKKTTKHTLANALTLGVAVRSPAFWGMNSSIQVLETCTDAHVVVNCYVREPVLVLRV